MPKLPNTLIVLPYDPNWKIEFERIRDYLMEQIGDLVIEIKHVGSTSIPGLCAKPIIDIVAVMESYDVFPAIVSRLEKVGFQHEGDGGIKEREVFKRLIPDDFMDYHFYVCPKDSEESRRQNIFRNTLLNNKDIADEYGKLKMRLVEEVNGDRVLYTDSKTDFILGVINKAIQEEKATLDHKGTVALETERLILRRFVMDDLEPYYKNCLSDHEVWKWSTYCPMNCIEDAVNVEKQFTEKWFAQYDNPNFYNWAIELKESGEVIGRIRGMNPDDKVSQVEFAYEIGRKWWNKGLMTEAVKKAIDFFFNSVGFNRVYSSHAHENPASGRVMQKCGMIYEGIMRQAVNCNNGMFDKVNYAILADDYFDKSEAKGIKEIIEANEKSKICNDILRTLPNWFGVEASIIDYVGQVKQMPFFAAFDCGKPIGFVAIKIHNSYTAEVCVMGVIKEYHRHGVGKRLIGCCDEYCRNNGIEFLTVKTLDESRESKSYEKTRLFYKSVGFKPLEIFPLFWDENNPCLFMAKKIEVWREANG